MSARTHHRTPRVAILAAALIALAAAACSDATDVVSGRDAGATFDIGPGADLGPNGDAGPGGPDAARDASAAGPDARAPQGDAAPPGPPPLGWIEVELEPRRALYTLEDTPQAIALGFHRGGQPADVGPIAWTVAPAGAATVDDAGNLTLLAEGQGAVIACRPDGLCGRAAFYVDAGPPKLVLSQPERGAVLGADGSGTIAVRGTATDSGGVVTVWVNGERVEVGPAGVFALDVPARFGVNRIEVVADDGVQRPAVKDVRDVLWSPAFTRVEDDGVRIEGAVVARLEQVLLDDDAPPDLPEGAGEVVLDELAQVVEGLLLLADPASLLGDPVIADSAALRLEVTAVDLGAPEVDLVFTREGIELFVQLPQARVETRGGLTLEGAPISLDGALEASLAAFARLRLSLDPTLSVEVDAIGVTLERITGDYASPTASALVSSLGSQLGQVAQGLAVDLIDELVRDQLPGLVESGFDALLGALGSIPLDLDTGVEGIPPVRLEMQLEPTDLEVRRHNAMTLTLGADIRHPQPVTAPHDDPGVPTFEPLESLMGPGEGLTVRARLTLLNALLHEVWRAGLLQIRPPLPEQLAGVLGDVQLDGRLPPVIAPSPPRAEFPLEVQVGDLRMTTTGPLAMAPDVYALSLRVGVFIEVVEASIELVIAEAPTIEAVLIQQGSARPLLTPEALAQLVEIAVWPMVQDALAGGLGLGLDPIEVDTDSLAELAPRLQGLRIVPRFATAPRVVDGRLHLDGGLRVHVTLGE